MSLYTILTVKYSAMSSHLEPANHSSNLGAKIQIPVQVVTVTHYLKSQIFVKKSILTKPQHFHGFFTKFFFDNFSREIEVVNS